MSEEGLRELTEDEREFFSKDIAEMAVHGFKAMAKDGWLYWVKAE